MKELSNKDLIEILDKRVQLEKENEAELIDYIREVNYRSLWIDFGATSMFDFLSKARYNYCASVAHRKLSAANLMQRFPHIKELIASGELNITQLGIAESVFKKYAPCLKVQEDILREMKNQTVDATRQILNEKINIEIRRHQKIRMQRDGSVLADLTFEAEEWAIIQEVKALLSHVIEDGNLVKLFVHLCTKELRKTSPKEGTPRYTKGIPKWVHDAVRDRDKTCRFKKPDGSFCCSDFQCQTDHIISRSRGGGNNIENLQLLCGFHNRLKYKRNG